LLDPIKSAYKKSHSTETALLRIHNDIICPIDKGKGVFLILLDLSAAFETVDHHIFLYFLENHIGLHGTVLILFRSYLTGRTQCVSINGVLSELKELAFGVPQGSVLGPIELCTYTLPLSAIIHSHKLDYQFMLLTLSSIFHLIIRTHLSHWIPFVHVHQIYDLG